LRQAILDANANPGRDLILFNIPGNGVQTISVLTDLPVISDTVTIDGRSEGVFQGMPDYSGPPLIQLSGPGSSSMVDGLVLAASNSTIDGLAVNQFGRGIEINNGATGVFVTGNYIGTLADGQTTAGNAQGILITLASGNTIGGTSPADRNV